MISFNCSNSCIYFKIYKKNGGIFRRSFCM